MSNKNLLSKKIPYINDDMSIVDAFNNMAKILNSTFRDKAVINEQGSLSLSLIDGLDFSSSFSSGSGASIHDFTFSHNFGSDPSGFLVLDLTSSGIGAGGSISLFRTSWTTTQISVRIIVDTNVAGGHSGSFKIKVLR